MFNRLQKNGLKVNARKSCFSAHKFDFLGYHVTRDGVMPNTKERRGHSIPRIPKNLKTIASVYRYDQLYHDMWKNPSELLLPLTALTSKNVK